MTTPSPSSEPRSGKQAARYAAASVVSGHLDTRTAALEVASQLEDEIGGEPDLLLLFASYHHRAAFDDGARSIRETLSPRVMLGVTAEAVLGADEELDGHAGFSALALRLGDASLHTWTTGPQNPAPMHDPAGMRERIGFNPDLRAAIFLADPFTTPISRLLPALTNCGSSGDDAPDTPVPIVGGMASGGTQPGLNVLILNDEVLSAGGGVGVSISGPVEIDFVVSQGCKPVGKPMVVTRVDQNVILELGSRKAMEALQEMAQALADEEKQMLTKGLLVGTVINEYKDRFGRGDFLIRNVLGFDQQRGGIAVGDVPRVGQTIQFHVRDAATAREDLELLLEAQQLDEPPFGALLFTCNGRGVRLFGEPGHDLELIHDRLGGVPTAGFFAAGEIGPIGTTSFLHGHTASLVLFRKPR